MRTILIAAVLIAAVSAEFCAQDSDCFMENCPGGYSVRCLDTVCTCESGSGSSGGGECSVSNDCYHVYGNCENNDKHWYCNEGRCCCGEPCPGAVDHYHCNSPLDCSTKFYRCDNNDKHWYCTNNICHCGCRTCDNN